MNLKLCFSYLGLSDEPKIIYIYIYIGLVLLLDRNLFDIM